MLAILATHPIQYQVPIWQALAARGKIPFKVLYLSDQGLRARLDPGFGRPLAWDIDLLGGYDHEFVPVRQSGRSDRFFGLRLRPGFDRVLRDRGARALWLQGWQTAAYWQAVLQARRCGVEIWMRGDTNLRSNAGGLRQDLKRVVLRRFLSRIDRFLYVGQANREFYLHQGVREAQMAPAPHCVDNDRFASQAEALRPRRMALRARWGVAPDAFCVLFVGKFIPKKRPLDVVEAVKRLNGRASGRPLHILWVGTGEMEAQLRNAVATDGGGAGEGKPAASFAGFLNQSEIVEAYVAADCLVLPSNVQETWGLVVNEAMACGLPCVVSDACGCAEDLVQPVRPDLCYRMGDAGALAAALAQAASNPPAASLLRAHIATYDDLRTVETVEDIYQDMLKRNAA